MKLLSLLMVCLLSSVAAKAAPTDEMKLTIVENGKTAIVLNIPNHCVLTIEADHWTYDDRTKISIGKGKGDICIRAGDEQLFQLKVHDATIRLEPNTISVNKI